MTIITVGPKILLSLLRGIYTYIITILYWFLAIHLHWVCEGNI